MALSKEQTIVARNMYGPLGEEIAVWLTSLTDRKAFDTMRSLVSLTPLWEDSREGVLHLVEKSNRVQYMNRTVEDVSDLVVEMCYPNRMQGRDYALQDLLVYMAEASVVADLLLDR